MTYKMNFFQRVLLFITHRLVYVLPNQLYIKIKFRLVAGYKLNLDNPQSFNEKLQWLKFNDIHKEYSNMVDKALAKDYVALKVGAKYIIPTYGVYDSVHDIDWASLPNQFVLKSTGDSGGVAVCKDKKQLNIQKTIKYLKTRTKKNYYVYNKEYPYKYIKPRYIAEAYLVDESGYELKDYKFFCFNGVPRFVQIDFNRYICHRRNVYDADWNLLDLQIKYPKGHECTFEKPENYEEMLYIASRLSEGIPHVRIDLYNVNGKIYFGEITFFHGSGMEIITPIKWDYKFGQYINLDPQTNKL